MPFAPRLNFRPRLSMGAKPRFAELKTTLKR
jgi:hypothetical protein